MSKYITRVYVPNRNFKEILDYVEANSSVEIDSALFEATESYPTGPLVKFFTNKPVIKNSTYKFYGMNYIADTQPNEIEFLTIEESEELDKSFTYFTDSNNTLIKK